MLRSSMPAASPELDQLVANMLREDADFDRHESRSMHREHLVRSVLIQLRQPHEKIITSFSRNISGHGIGLITQEPIPGRATAVLTVEGLRLQDTSIISECRWCLAYGANWHFSGWQFKVVRR